MKINLSDAIARKVLGNIPANTEDQDLQQLRLRLEAGMNRTSPMLTADELDAVMHASMKAVLALRSDGLGNYCEDIKVKQLLVKRYDDLTAAIPKLELLRDRQLAVEESRG
jgi:hypothetical protein